MQVAVPPSEVLVAATLLETTEGAAGSMLPSPLAALSAATVTFVDDL